MKKSSSSRANKGKKSKGGRSGKPGGKKPASGRGGNSGTEENESRLAGGKARALCAVVLLAVAVFTFICIFAPSSAGPVGRGVKTGLAWMIGLGRFVFPFLLLLSAALVLARRPRTRPGLVALGAVLIAVSVLTMLHIPRETAVMFGSDALSSGGGLIGAAFAWPLTKLTGKVGAYIFSVAALIAGVILAFGEQLISLFKRRREAEKPGEVEEKAPRTPKKPPATGGKKKPAPGEPARVYPSNPVPPVEVKEEPSGQMAMEVKGKGGGRYKLPPGSILNRSHDKAFSKQTNEERKRAIETTLQSMDVDARVVKVSKGPTVSLFEVEVGTGEKVKRVTELEQDIAYALGSPDIRIYSPIPGRQAIGIEVPNHIRDTVVLGDIMSSLDPVAPHNQLTMAIGKDMSGQPVVLDLAQLPHLLLAGSTGAGKSCCINSLVCCLLFRCRPDELKLIMIDPKFVEFTWYEKLPHLLCDVINEPEPASKALLWAVNEMDTRYQMLQKQKVVHIDDYNAIAAKDDELEHMPKIVVVIDELGDLMIVARREVESSISRLTAKARAVGIHLIIATQRPSVDVITGVIKNNIPARIAFQVASNADSRTILGTKGAEKLQGKGDMLLDPGNIPQPVRVQGALIRQKEIELLTGYIREQKFRSGVSIDLKEVADSVKAELSDRDPLLEEAADFVVHAGEASASMLQTHLRVGYARARRLIVELAEIGLVGPHEGSKPRKVLVSLEEYEDWRSRQGA